MRRLIKEESLKNEGDLDIIRINLNGSMDIASIPQRIWAEVMLAVLENDLEQIKLKGLEEQVSLSNMREKIHLEEKYNIREEDIRLVLREVMAAYYCLTDILSEKIEAKHLFFPTEKTKERLKNVTSKQKTKERKIERRSSNIFSSSTPRLYETSEFMKKEIEFLKKQEEEEKKRKKIEKDKKFREFLLNSFGDKTKQEKDSRPIYTENSAYKYLGNKREQKRFRRNITNDKWKLG